MKKAFLWGLLTGVISTTLQLVLFLTNLNINSQIFYALVIIIGLVWYSKKNAEPGTSSFQYGIIFLLGCAAATILTWVIVIRIGGLFFGSGVIL
jgi:hypothetical protein